MDILRAVIVGPAGTPYHDGLFFFDIFFPPTYPLNPPVSEIFNHTGRYLGTQLLFFIDKVNFHIIPCRKFITDLVDFE